MVVDSTENIVKYNNHKSSYILSYWSTFGQYPILPTAATQNTLPCGQFGVGSTFLNLQYFNKYNSSRIHASVVNRKEYKVCECSLKVFK
jgi:hypothetical protein